MTAAVEAQRAVGARLRDIRRSLGWSLADVELKSGGRWKAVVVGSYERGDRAISVARLVDLAAFYRVPAWGLLKPLEPAVVRADEAFAAACQHVHAAAELLARLADEERAW